MEEFDAGAEQGALIGFIYQKISIPLQSIYSILTDSLEAPRHYSS
jgi:hypothetical protein